MDSGLPYPRAKAWTNISGLLLGSGTLNRTAKSAKAAAVARKAAAGVRNPAAVFTPIQLQRQQLRNSPKLRQRIYPGLRPGDRGSVGIDPIKEMTDAALKPRQKRGGGGFNNRKNRTQVRLNNLQSEIDRQLKLRKLGYGNEHRLESGTTKLGRGKNKLDVVGQTELSRNPTSKIEEVRVKSLQHLKNTDVLHANRAFAVILTDPLTEDLGKILMALDAEGKLNAQTIIRAQENTFNKYSTFNRLGPSFEWHHGDYTVSSIAEIAAITNPVARARAFDMQRQLGRTFGDAPRLPGMKQGMVSVPRKVHQGLHLDPLTGKVDFDANYLRNIYKHLNKSSSAEEISDTISITSRFVEGVTDIGVNSKTYHKSLQQFLQALPQDTLKNIMGSSFKSLSPILDKKELTKFQSVWRNQPVHLKNKIKEIFGTNLRTELIEDMTTNNSKMGNLIKGLLKYQ